MRRPRHSIRLPRKAPSQIATCNRSSTGTNTAVSSFPIADETEVIAPSRVLLTSKGRWKGGVLREWLRSVCKCSALIIRTNQRAEQSESTIVVGLTRNQSKGQNVALLKM